MHQAKFVRHAAAAPTLSNDEPLTSGASIPGIAAPAGEEALPTQVLVRAVRGDALFDFRQHEED